MSGKSQGIVRWMISDNPVRPFGQMQGGGPLCLSLPGPVKAFSVHTRGQDKV